MASCTQPAVCGRLSAVDPDDSLEKEGYNGAGRIIMSEKIKAYTRQILIFLARKILLIDLILLGVVALSCLLWGPFTAEAYSERLIWVGIGVALVAGVLVTGQTVGGRQYGVSPMFGSAYGNDMIKFNIEVRQAIETRMGLLPRIFLIGAVLFGLGALVQVLFG
jgi:hypothetical protein